MGKIYAAKTNHITNPVGFYMEQIVFSWKVKECEGKKQKNARILISKEKDFSEILFDTKEAELDSCGTKVNFQTAPYTRYYWKVIVTTDQGEVVGSDVQFLRLQSRTKHGPESGLPVVGKKEDIQSFPSWFLRKKRSSGQDSISVVWDCTRHILPRIRSENQKKSERNIWLHTATIMISGSSTRPMM